MIKTIYTCDRCGKTVYSEAYLRESSCVLKVSQKVSPDGSFQNKFKKKPVQLCFDCDLEKKMLDEAIEEASANLYKQFLEEEKPKTEKGD